MSQHPPPPPPYGAPPQYGAPQYGAPQYGAPQYGAPQYGGPGHPAYGPPVPPGGYASWGRRVAGYLWDVVVVLPALAVMTGGAVLLAVGGAIGEGGAATALIIGGVVVLLAAYAWGFYLMFRNIWFDQGRTGWTYGKRKVGIRVLREVDGQPMGVGNAVARWLLHGLLNSCLMLDYLWPLWDPRNQTLTDKVLGTVVIHQHDPTRPR
jgi:uncharacterized RDD family membrane protein YckC